MNNTDPHYISNAPIGDDQFKGQSHRRISGVMAEEIREGASRMIGLDGGWGSGKSNLIKQVDKELNGTTTDSSKEYPVIIYDAWGHIADLQRRSILEEATNSLISKHEALGKNWVIKLDELLAKKKATRTKKMPALSTPLVTLLISVLLVPVMNYIIDNFPDGSEWKWLFPIGYAFLVILIMAGERWFAIRKNEKYNPSIKKIFGEMFMLYQGQISEDTTYEVVSEEEPSSIQFKKWMHDLDDSLNDKIKRVVLVFDNLDRLPGHKVQEFWAAIHSFFAEEKFNRIVVVVPFDRAHVINAFKSENDEGKERSYGDDFINKTFDVVFRVSPLILSDWKNYFNTKWSEAFGEGNSVPDAVTQIYDAFSPTITPRDIVSFINEYISVAKTSIDEIPAQYIALFIFGKKQIEKDPQKELLNPSFFGSLKFLYENDKDIPKYLSALYYQLPVSEAMDVVFTRTCQQALDNNTPEQLTEMLTRPTIFLSVIENAILNITNIENATLCMNSLELDNLSQDAVNRLWKCVFRKLSFNTLEQEGVKDYQFILLKHLASKPAKISLATAMIKGYRYSEENNPQPDNYVKGVRLLREYDPEIMARAISPSWKISAELFVRLVERAGSDWHTMTLFVDDKELDHYLASLDVERLKTLQVIPLLTEMELYKASSFEEYRNSLREKISANTNNLGNLYPVLARLKEIERPISNISAILPDNIIFSLSENSTPGQDGYYEMLTIALSRGTAYSYNNRGKLHTPLTSNDTDVVSIVANRIESYVDFGDLLINEKAYSNLTLGKAVVTELTKKSHGVSRCILKDCIMQFDAILKNYELEPSILFNRLSQWNCDSLEFTNDEMFSLPLSVVEQAVANENKLGSKICHLINEYLNAITQEQWKTNLKNDSHTVQLYLSFKPTNYQTLVDAVFEMIKVSIQDGKGIQPIPSLEKILKKMVVANEPLENKLIEIVDFVGLGHGMKADIFCASAPWVFTLASSSLNEIDKFERFIPSDILSNASVLSILEKHQRLLLRYRKPESFKSKLRQMAESTHKNDQEFMKFAKALGIVRTKKEKS